MFKGLDSDAAYKLAKNLGVANKEVVDFVRTSKGGLKEYEAAMQSASKSTSNFQKGLSTLKNIGGTLLSTFTNMAVAMAASWAVGKVIEGINNYIHRVEIAIEKGEEAREKLSGIYEEYDSASSVVNGSGERFGTLREGVNAKTNENISLTNEEYSEYLSLCNQIADVYPQLVTSYDAQGNAILNLGTDAETATAQLDALLEKQQQVAYSDAKEEIGTALTGSMASIGEYKKQLKGLEEDIASTDEVINLSTKQNNILAQLKSLYDTQRLEFTDATQDVVMNTVMPHLVEHGIDFAGNRATQYDDNGNIIGYYEDLTGFPATQEEWDAIIDEIGKNLELEFPDVSNSSGFDKVQLLGEKSGIESQIQSEWDTIVSDIQKFVKNEANYNALSAEMQELIQQSIANTDMSMFPELSEDEYAEYIENTYIRPISDLYNSKSTEAHIVKAKTALANLFNLGENVGTLNVNEYDEQLNAQLSTLEEYWKTIKGEEEGEEFYKEFVLRLGFKVQDEDGNLIDSNSMRRYELEELAAANGENTVGLGLNELTVEQLIEVETIYKDSSNGQTLQEVIDQVTSKAQEAVNSVESITFSSILSSEDVTKQVDDFQSNISTIQDVLDKLKTGEFTDSDITDLKQQFPSLVTETENLESALNNLAVDNFISTMSSIRTAMEGVTDPTQLAAMKSFGEDLKKQFISALDMSDVTADDLLNNFKEVTSLDNWNPTAFQNSFGKLVSEFGGSEAGRAGLITLAAAIELDPSLAYADYETLKAYVEDNKVIANIEFSQNRIEELQSQMTTLQDEATKVQDSLSLKEAKGIKPLVSDYTKLVNNSEQQVWNLKKQNAELQKQLVELDVNDSKYQEIQSQINANVSAIDQAKIAQIEWNEQASRLRYEPNEGLTAYNKAKSTRNAGDNYLDMMSGLKEAKEAYDAGLIGTDDFKEYARMISPSGATDPANFLENYGKVSEWFTEGADGVKTFLNELDSKGLAEFNEETQQWTYSIEDMAKAANQMGVSEEVMLAMFGRLEDYGFRNNYVSSVEDGVQRLSNLYSDLAKEEALLKEMESKPSEYTDEQVQSKKDLIESIKQNIDETGQSMDYVVANAGETYNTQIESAKSAIESLAEQRKNILDNNLYGENSEAVANQLEKQILGLAEENGLQLDLEYNVVGQEDVTNATNALRTLQENGKISIDLDFNKSDMSADELQQKIDELNETKATINVDDEGGQEALDEINAIINACETEKQLKLALDKGSTVNDLLQLTDEELINTLQIDTSQVDVAKQRLQEIAEGEEIPITVKIDESQFNQLLETEKSITVDSSSIDEAQEKANTLNETSIEDKAVNVNSSSINEAQKKLDKINATNLENKTFSVISNASTTLSTLSTLDSYLSRIDGRVVSYTVNKTVTGSSVPFASGTLTPARANGTAYNVLNMKPAYANGRKVALEHDETALVNELGTEGLIRSGKLFEIPGGMHYQSLKKGDIILSVEQMRQLSLTGRASGKARAYAEGTIGSSIPLMNSYANSTVGGGSLQGGAATSSSTPSTKSLTQAVSNLGNTSTKSTKKVSSLSKALETLEKLFDWVEVRLDRLQSRIDLQLAKADNEIGYQDKNERISKAQDITSTLIKANKKGAKEYEAYANKVAKEVGLSKTLKRKVQNGTIDIESLDEDDQKRVEAYSQWYEKMLQCKQAVEELKTSQKELAQQKMDNIVERYDGIISHITHAADLINGSIELSEAQGYVQSTKYYESLSENKALERQKLVAERDALQKELNDAVNSGIITKPGNGSRGSEEWYTMQSQIYEVDKAIQDADISAQEFENTIRDIKWEQFERGQEALQTLTDESKYLIDLMANEDMYDDKGKVTDKGIATFGLHTANLETYKKQVADYETELASIDKHLEQDPYDKDYLQRRQEIIKSIQDTTLAYKDEEQAIVDLVKEGIEKQLDSLQNLIDKYMDAIKTQKNLYDYQNDVADQAKEIATLQKRLVAYAGDDSDDGRLKRQELQNDLDEAKKNLKETEYEKYISDQEEILDELYKEYEDTLNKRLDDVDKLIKSVADGVSNNTETIKQTLETEVSEVGTSLSTSMGTIWGSNGSFTQNFNTAVGNISSFLEQLVKAADNNSGNTDPPEDPGNGAQSVRAGVKAIMAKGTAHEGAATEEEKAKHSELWTYLVDNFGYAPASGTTKELADLLGVKVSKKITDKDKDAVLTALKSKLGDTSGEGSFKKKFDDIIATGKKRDKKLTDDEKKNKSDLWKYIVKNYGREPVSGMMTNLGTLFGVKDVSNPPSKKQKDDILKAMKARGYASGTDYVKKNQWANLNEEGQEIITLPDGTILMPLAQGSGVINNPNTEKLLSLANNYDAIQKMLDSISVVNMSKQASAMDALEKQLISSQVVNNGGGEYHITNKITLELPNVNKPEDIINYLKRSDKFLDFMQTATIGRINGKSSMTRYK